MKVADPSKFKVLEVVLCPHCGEQNLSWRIVCTWCHKDLEEQAAEAEKNNAEAAA